MSDHQLSLSDVRTQVSDIRVAMLTTIDEAGTLSSRPLTVQDIDEEGHVVFVVDKNADWVTAGVSAVNVALSDDNIWVSIAGRLTFTDDPALLDELWGPLTSEFFPDGKETATVAHVAAETWEYWTSPNRFAQAFEISKSMITGEQPDLGTSGRIDV